MSDESMPLTSIPFIAHPPVTVGANGNGEGAFREMTLPVDCRLSISDNVAPWALGGILFGAFVGGWRGSTVVEKERQKLSSKRRRQREQSKRRRQERKKTKTTSGTQSSETQRPRRRAGDFQIGYAMHQAALWGMVGGGALGLFQGIYTAFSKPLSESACRDAAIKRLKSDQGNWAVLGGLAGAAMYILQKGPQDPHKIAQGESNYLLISAVIGSAGAWALSKLT